MIAPGSLIGFALVFVFCTWGASVIAGLWLTRATKELRQRGAAAEKQAAALALIIPPLLGMIAALSLAGFSVALRWAGLADHCGSHGHHLHLCLFHGSAWSEQAWALFLVAGLSAIVLSRLARLGGSAWLGHRRLRIVESSSSRILDHEIPVFRSPSEREFCFVAGLRAPRIFVAAALWNRLPVPQRNAMIEHERVHVANGDLRKSVMLSVIGLFGAPIIATQCKRLWSEAAERLCDRVAADRLGDSEAIAVALIDLARGPRLASALSFLPRPESVRERVIAVLSQEQTGERFAQQLLRRAAGLVTIIAMVTAALADPLHHALETVFSLI